jgi:hypothetical protein
LPIEGAGIGNIETTQPIKTQEILPPAQDSTLLMAKMPIKYPELEEVPISGSEQLRNPAED